MMQLGGFFLYKLTRPLIKGLETMPKFIDNKLKLFLKNKEKFFDTIQKIYNSIKGIKSIKKFLEQK